MYDWLRDHGNIIAALFTMLATAFGWHVKRYLDWRMTVEQRMDDLVSVATMRAELERIERINAGHIAMIKERLDRADRHLDRRFGELAKNTHSQIGLVRDDLSRVHDKLDRALQPRGHEK